jgi:hypothetical protein
VQLEVHGPLEGFGNAKKGVDLVGGYRRQRSGIYDHLENIREHRGCVLVNWSIHPSVDLSMGVEEWRISVLGRVINREVYQNGE